MATQWIEITPEDVENYLLAAQLAALRSAALGNTQTDPLPAQIRESIDYVRAKIASCPRNRLSVNPATVPPSLKAHTIYVAIFRCQLRIPMLKLTEQQMTAYRNALDDLNRVADCKDAVEAPIDPTTLATGSLTPAYINPKRRFTHEQQDGI